LPRCSAGWCPIGSKPYARATLVVFDVLAIAGEDLRTLPYQARRARVEELVTENRTGLALVPAISELAGARHGWATACRGARGN
jgi:ATP-dependent DNA ligase